MAKRRNGGLWGERYRLPEERRPARSINVYVNVNRNHAIFAHLVAEGDPGAGRRPGPEGTMPAITGGSKDLREQTEMTTGKAPVKTDQGHDEIAHRTRRLSQRHRTVLLFVDGRRDEDEILWLAVRAGVPPACYAELVELGLVASPGSAQGAVAPDSTDETPTPPLPLRAAYVRSGMAPLSDSAAVPLDTSIEADAVVPPVPPAPQHTHQVASAATAESSRTTLLEDDKMPESWDPGGFDDPITRALEDRPLEEARELLIRAVTREAPLAGSLTLIRLRRARSREEMQELLDEVESRISRPRNREMVEQTLRRARHLLGLSSHTSFLVSR
jgi:hypothetical protein